MKNKASFIRLICTIFGENIYDILNSSNKRDKLIKEVENVLNKIDSDSRQIIELEYGLYGNNREQDEEKVRDIISIIKKPENWSNLSGIIMKFL